MGMQLRGLSSIFGDVSLVATENVLRLSENHEFIPGRDVQVGMFTSF